MNVNKALSSVEKFLKLKCDHQSAENSDCNFCPDCGKRIETKWLSIKCQKCGHLRTAKKSNESIIPEKHFCFNCGSDRWGYQYYYDYNIPDKLKEISVKQIVEVEENPFDKSNDNSTKIWVETPFHKEKKFHKNIIKHK